MGCRSAITNWFSGGLLALWLVAALGPLRAAEVELAAEPDEEQAAAALRTQTATHKQVAEIQVASESGTKLLGFRVTPDGQVLALVHVGMPDDVNDDGHGVSLLSLLFGAKKKPPAVAREPGCQVRSYDPDGKQTGSWPVEFMAQAIGVGPRGEVYLAGGGHLARYSTAGEQLAIADAPQTASIDKQQLRESAEVQIEEEKHSNENFVKQFQEQRDELAGKDADEMTAEDREQIKILDGVIEQFKTAPQAEPAERNVDDVMEEIANNLKGVNAVAASERDVFVTCRQAKGYGYAVWRTDADFSNPKQIITGLSGCCGQMDVCCQRGELWVAENSRHRVERYDREGKQLSHFGKSNRDGLGANFGSCCNPMNLCFGAGGELFAAESDGQVKQFSTQGKFSHLVGVAHVRAGCKNSAIAVSSNNDRVYYIDVQKSAILVLAPNEQPAKNQ